MAYKNISKDQYSPEELSAFEEVRLISQIIWGTAGYRLYPGWNKERVRQWLETYIARYEKINGGEQL